MIKKTLNLSLLILFLATSSAFSAEKLRIAVLNLKADGIPKRTARTVSNMIRTELINLKKFTVIERTQMDTILKEQGFQQTGCTDQECAVQMGKLMSAKKILIGEVSLIGKSIIITIRIVDVEKGVSEFAAKQNAASVDVLDKAVSRIVRKLSVRIEGGEESEGPAIITSNGYYIRGIVPGWGQSYAGHSTKGVIYGGLFVLTGAFTVLAFMNYNTKKSDYEDQGPPQSEIDKKYDDYKQSSQIAWCAVGLFAAVYVANWVDLIFFSQPDFGNRIGITDISNSFITLDINRPHSFISDNSEKNMHLGIGVRF